MIENIKKNNFYFFSVLINARVNDLTVVHTINNINVDSTDCVICGCLSSAIQKVTEPFTVG